jgi:hypothetical protein
LQDNNRWMKMCLEIESRTLQPSLLRTEKPKVLYQQLIKILEIAFEQNILGTKPHVIRSLVKLNDTKQVNEFEIVGGVKNFKRRKDAGPPTYFERIDGCWFDFSIMIRKNKESAEIIGFDFEIRFPDNVPGKFLRFDLNLPEHDNEDLGMRFHLHPGNDDFIIHAPPMSPIEILHLFLYGFTILKKQRSS